VVKVSGVGVSPGSFREAAGRVRAEPGAGGGHPGHALRRLTSLESASLEKEHASLAAAGAELAELIGSKKRVLEVIEKEALALKEEFGSPGVPASRRKGTRGPL